MRTKPERQNLNLPLIEPAPHDSIVKHLEWGEPLRVLETRNDWFLMADATDGRGWVAAHHFTR